MTEAEQRRRAHHGELIDDEGWLVPLASSYPLPCDLCGDVIPGSEQCAWLQHGQRMANGHWASWAHRVCRDAYAAEAALAD